MAGRKRLWLSACYDAFPLLAAAILWMFTAATASAASGKCVLRVDGHTYLNGPCDITMQAGGSFGISSPQNARPVYYVDVQLDSALPGTAAGFWNGEEAASHLHYDLGTLTRKGACWSNSRATVCAAR